MSKSLPQHDPLSPLAREVLALFTEALPEVRFPDVDLAVLDGAAGELRALQCHAEQVEAEFEAARAEVRQRAEALTQQAQRALAYARVFAEADPALALRVAAIPREGQAVASSGRCAQSKKRGRARKDPVDSNLFADPGVLEVADVEAADAEAADAEATESAA